VAQRKKALVKEGKLDKYGRKNDQTPSDYLSLIAGKPSSSAVVAAVADRVPESATEEVNLTEGGSAEKDKKKKKKKKDKEDGDESPIHKKTKA
jgi:H/ACA ribonucleoprotein complex subunit 4